MLLVLWAVCALYVWHYLPRGWVPHDEGNLAQSAERVLRGQLPHRDFAEIYTGGLSFLDALAFRVLGVKLFSLRVPLFAVFLAWVPALYYIATRIARPLAAGAVVLLAVAWSLPNYSAAMPSWYNLFLATFGTAALFRYLEVDRSRWLFVAGVAGGISCVVKIVGLYYIAAVLLFLVYREQDMRRGEQSAPLEKGWNPYRLFVGLGLLCFILALVALVKHQLGASDVIHFVVPGAALAGFLLWAERSVPAGGALSRFRCLFRLAAPFLLGVLLPVAIFLIPYVRSGSLTPLFNGVFIIPAKRFSFASMRPPGGIALIMAIPTAASLGFIPSWRPRLPRLLVGAVALVLLGMVVVNNYVFYRLAWASMRILVPLTVLAGIWLLVRGELRRSVVRRQQLVLLLSMATLCSLVQFPFAGAIYFMFAAPLIALAALGVVAWQARPAPLAPCVALVFYVLFAVVRIHPGFVYEMGVIFVRDHQTTQLGLDRGGILVSSQSSRQYSTLVTALRAHASGHYIYATPDCPEVYFLSGYYNPTRTIFDFFDNPVGRLQRVLHALDVHHVAAIALNQQPEFSGPVPPALDSALTTRYPQHERIGHFIVRWRQ